MTRREAAKKKRAPGGGRKPINPSQRMVGFSVRIPATMRDELEKAADKRRLRKWNGSDELRRRLQESFDQDRKNYSDPETQALCFLFADLSVNVHRGTPNWRSNPFLFRAFKLAVAKLLDNMPSPAGKVETPLFLKEVLTT